MKHEIDALESNDTWILITLPARKKALSCKWIYITSNLKLMTLLIDNKVQLVILGNNHVAGEDFHKTCAPIAKLVISYDC